jgi:Arm DNA-binding domain/Phage integrase, N-terminal SAM-like domain
MLRRTRLDDEGVSTLRTKKARYAVPDPELRGHYIRVGTNGSKSFWAVTRDPTGSKRWRKIGNAPAMSIDNARTVAAKILRQIRRDGSASSFAVIAEEWIERHVVKNKLRSGRHLEQFLRKHILPAFHGLDMAQVTRREISKLLDRLQHEHGPRQADYGLSIVRPTWH